MTKAAYLAAVLVVGATFMDRSRVWLNIASATAMSAVRNSMTVAADSLG
jgi:hypothetical protein